MRRTVLLAAAAIAGTAALSGSASAQSVGVYVEPGPAYDGYYYYGPVAPRVYGYSRNYYRYDDDDGAVVGYRPLPYPRGGCGTYFFWNGETCVDARR